MPEFIVVDTSCLIALSRINQLELLQKLYNEVIITPEIKEEFKYALPEWIKILPIADNDQLHIINAIVDIGEASAINFCLQNKDSLLVIDDNKGRKLAKRLELKVTGTLGLLARAKQKGYINSVKPHLNSLEMLSSDLTKDFDRLFLNR